MIYAERIGNENEEYIAERGVFLSLEEFVEYRKLGWTSTPEINQAADDILEIKIEEWS